MCKFPLTDCLQKILKHFVVKRVQSVSLWYELSKKLKVIKICATTESGSKQRFSLVQEKAVIKVVCLWTQAVSINARF